MNWRKHIIIGLLKLRGSTIPDALKQISQWEFKQKSEIENMQKGKLTALLQHAWENVPYYHRVLGAAGAVTQEGVKLENFQKIPMLTKGIIREQGQDLHSRDLQDRKIYENTSGGSTGEPIRFIQDAEYDDWNIATKIYFNYVLGKEPGEPEIKFWGSDRDIIEGNLAVKDRVINFLYNRKFFNTYRLGEKELKELIDLNNSFKPVAYWSYMESALELAKYLSEKKVEFYSPRFLISTIGPLTEEVRNKIENQMHCRVYNQYGSREVGALSCECKEQKAMHLFPWWNYVEILDSDGHLLTDGQGNVVVTTLHNFSMPLIRYEIGDVAVPGGNECPCGRKTFQLKKVLGRTLGYFKKADGSLAHSHFLVQALFFRDWIKRFQIVQDAINHVIIKIQKNDSTRTADEELAYIVEKTKILMGRDCEVEFQFVDEITRASSGKFVYTLCKVR